MNRSSLRSLTTGGLCLCALTLVACDSRELVAPGLRPEGRARAALSEAVSLGSDLLPPPPNTSGAPGAAVRLGTVPANTWVVFQVSGSVSGSWNPECSGRPPAWPCAAGAVVQSFMAGADPYAPVTIAYSYDGGASFPGRVLLRGTAEGSAIGLFQSSAATTLDGFVKANTLTSWDPNFGTMIPSYINLSGGYTVTGTLVPSPFRVTESAPDESGTITYTAEPLYGLQFSNPYHLGHLPPGDLVWKFFPGDSLSDEPDHSWPGWYMYHCERKLVCQFRPPGPGRMQVSAFVERQTAYVRGRPAQSQCPAGALAASPCVPQESLKLTCDSTTVARGGMITCTAAAEPIGATLGVTKWTFEGEGSVIHPEAGDEHEPTWSGRMVVSGTITVTGVVNGKEVPPAKVEITVRPRQAFMIRYPPFPEVEWVGGEGAELPYPPQNMAPGTDAHGILGKFREVSPSYALDEGSGPNAGWVYLPAPPEFTGLRFFLNKALQPDDPFYRLQQGDERKVDIRNSRPMCGPQFMARARTETEAHERGHYNISAQFWTRAAVVAAFEGWRVFDPEGRVNASYAKQHLTEPFWNQLGDLQKAWDGNDELRIPCDFAQP